MKEYCIFAYLAFSLSVLSQSALGQGTFLFRNVLRSAGLDAPVFDSLGTPLSGTNFLAELWGAATPNTLSPAVVLDKGLGREFAPFTFVAPGYFASSEGFLAISDIVPRGWAWLQVRAWDARLGSTYEQVAALGIGGYGESPLFYAQGGDPFDQFPTPAPLLGLQSFSLRPVVPEPSAATLLGLGLASFWWRRKKSNARN